MAAAKQIRIQTRELLRQKQVSATKKQRARQQQEHGRAQFDAGSAPLLPRPCATGSRRSLISTR
eukprot:11194399-Lingulodinium_polyedra.AAC.1